VFLRRDKRVGIRLHKAKRRPGPAYNALARHAEGGTLVYRVNTGLQDFHGHGISGSSIWSDEYVHHRRTIRNLDVSFQRT
jgi:hypothetical protein